MGRRRACARAWAAAAALLIAAAGAWSWADLSVPAVPAVLVLGTAQDGGFPHAACHCRRCSAARIDPAQARAVASLAILLPGTRTAHLIDATPDVRDQLERVRVALGRPAEGTDRGPVAGIFLTHAHMGHYLGLAFFGFEALHAREIALSASRRMVELLTANAPWNQLVRLRNVVPRPFDPAAAEAIDLGEGVRVTPFAVPHRGEYTDTVGYLISGPSRRVLYIPDSDPWEKWAAAGTTIEDLIRRTDPDVALLDGCFFSGGELPGRDLREIGHPLIVDSMARFAALVRAGRPRILFTHLNHSNPALEPGSPERLEVERRGYLLAADGDRFPLG